MSKKLNKEERNSVFQDSLKKAMSLSLIMFILYIYQTVLIQKKQHGLYSFFVLFICLLSVFYTLSVNIPEFNTNIQNGIGWGLGSTLVRQILKI